jgi:vitamin B12 transporter
VKVGQAFIISSLVLGLVPGSEIFPSPLFQTRTIWAATSGTTGAAASAPPILAQSSKKPSAPAKSKPRARQTSQASGKLPPIIVVLTPTGMPQPLGEVGTTTSVVSQKQSEVQQTHDLPTLLQQVPGVQVTQTGSPGTLAEVSIRGSTPAQNLIMLDGVPVNDSATGEFDISRIPTDGMDRVEVVRGAGGALYGSQAIGGVVNLFTQEGSGPPKFSLLSEGGNRATERQVAQFDGALGRLAYAGTFSYF